MQLVRRVVLLSAFFCAVRAFSAGPPGRTSTTSAPANYMDLTQGQLVCERLTPGHFGGVGDITSPEPEPQPGNGGYFIVSDLIDNLNGQFVAGVSYSCKFD